MGIKESLHRIKKTKKMEEKKVRKKYIILIYGVDTRQVSQVCSRPAKSVKWRECHLQVFRL